MVLSTLTSNTLNHSDQTRHFPKASSQALSSCETDDLFQEMIQPLLDQLFFHQGLMLLDHTGKLLHLNSKATEFCQMMKNLSTLETDRDNEKGENSISFVSIPEKILNLCQLMIDAKKQFPNQSFQLYEDVTIAYERKVRITGKQFEMAYLQEQYILIQLEDTAEAASQQAKCDAYRYKLTPRETEVWALRLQEMQRCEIAQKLFIELCTVKKHIKSINRKRSCDML